MLKSNFVTNTGSFAMREIQIGKRSTALEFWPSSCVYVGCRAGRSSRQGTVCVWACVSDVLAMSYGAMPFVDVWSGVTSKRGFKAVDQAFKGGKHPAYI